MSVAEDMRGHNNPPLEELLAEETVGLEARTDELVAAVGRASVTDDETAGKAVLLYKMLTTHKSAIDNARRARKEPFLEGGRQVDQHFALLQGPLGLALSELQGLIDAYRRKKEQEAAAERRRLEEEARKAAEEAAEAEEARQQSATTEDAIEAEIAQREAEGRAASLIQQAKQTVAAPINSGLGFKAHGRKVWHLEITDYTAALRHCRKIDDATVKACIQTIYERQVKAGVRELPGATITEDSTTVVR